MVRACLAQDTNPALTVHLTVEQCRVNQRSWAVLINEPTLRQVTFAQLALLNNDLRTCGQLDPAFSSHYESVNARIHSETAMRYFDFMQRHKLYNQFLAEDAQGKR